MAVNVSIFDLENFPSNPKTVTVDITELVPFGNNGEDTWVVSAITTATASGGAAIQRLYISATKFGWAKSSGLKTGPYSVNGSQKHLKVSIDEDISEAAEVALTESVLPIGGNALASDLQTQINDTARVGGAKEGNLAYLNAIVRFVDGRFEIISGTASDSYEGANKSSVAVADGVTTTGLLGELGFDINFTSEVQASTEVKQTSLASSYTSGTTLSVVDGSVVTGGDCIAVTDGTNTEFRGVQSVSVNDIIMASGMANTYASESLVQVLSLRDPSGEPAAAYTDIDDYVKFSINSIANQIDFSS
jgi:hypothetical protein